MDYNNFFEIQAEYKNRLGESCKYKLLKNIDSVFVFEDCDKNGNKISQCTVELICNNQSMCIKADAYMCHGANYDIRKTFFSFDSIKIIILPKQKITKVTGSYYPLTEKTDCWASRYITHDIVNSPKRIASVLWQQGNTYYTALPLCDGDFKSEIHGNGKEIEITIAPYTGGYGKICAKAAVISWGENPFKLMEENVAAGFEFLGLRRSMRKDKKLPEIFDYLGWCSWDSCRLDVNDEKIYKKAKEFEDKKVPVKWILIDDGWFPEKDGRILYDFKEDKSKFPTGLKAFTAELKNNCKIDWVGIWQCFCGDWQGIHPESIIAKQYPEILFRTNNNEILPGITEGKSFEFWEKWDGYLKNSGIDFVKVDVETNVEACTYNNTAIGKAARGAYYGMDAATAMYFNGAVINCTGMGHECLWNRPLGILNRNSMDFIDSDINSMRSFSVDNVYNSLYHSQFCYTDWDMMQTHGVTVKINTVLHAVSGAPVYLSDHIGKTQAEIANAFCDNTGKLYKCDDFAYPCEDILFSDPLAGECLLKFWNMSKDSGLLGVINVNEKGERITDHISPCDIKNLCGEKFVVYDYFNKKFSVMNYDEKAEIALDDCDAAMYQFTPIISGFAFVGNTEKYVSAASVNSVIDFNDRKILSLREGGKFSYYCEYEHELLINGEKAIADRRNGLYSFSYESVEKITIEIYKK